jgi:hypothetical protein
MIVFAIYFIIFLRLPAEAYYLLPAVAAIFLLLGVSLPPRSTAILPIALLASCFLIVEYDSNRVRLALKGPVLSNQRYQNTLQCIAKVVKLKIRNLDSETYIAAASLQPMLQVSLPDEASRIVYDATGKEGSAEQRKTLVLDRSFLKQKADAAMSNQEGVSEGIQPRPETVDTYSPCP